MAPTDGVLRRKVNDVFLMWDMDWQCFHMRLCKHSLFTLEVQHLFKQIKESSYFTFDALNFPLDNDPFIEPHSLFSNFSQYSIVDLGWGNQFFIPVHAWQMYEHVIYMMNSPFEGWHMIVTLVWWNKKIFWFLPKPYNENFLSDDHCVTHKSWVQDASRRVCPDAKKDSTYNLRTCSIHYVNMGRFSTWSQKGLISAQWRSL